MASLHLTKPDRLAYTAALEATSDICRLSSYFYLVAMVQDRVMTLGLLGTFLPRLSALHICLLEPCLSKLLNTDCVWGRTFAQPAIFKLEIGVPDGHVVNLGIGLLLGLWDECRDNEGTNMIYKKGINPLFNQFFFLSSTRSFNHHYYRNRVSGKF